ncbi:hypothetical protein BV25DRAFT_1922119 [Artomyces pyxidatus]|uniref:Uncharacterized protein n=1 Tax=Artomyces pyxidatus TaxID=48021 RepID=A0ACB8SGJ9_9AGAM|nr:hypothetical protein BV25DRAFT_1922119 [Artomyces pyxidatus]
MPTSNTTGPKESYYHRNRITRLEYQQHYISVKRRSGRRKLSQRARAMKEKEVERELLGISSKYTDTLAYRSHERDPARTTAMAVDEEMLLSRCTDIESDIRDSFPDQWIPQYVQKLQIILAERLGEGEACRSRGETNDGHDGQSHEHLHAHRRLVAGVHQEIELIQQGVEVRAMAAANHALILSGCRLNKTAFRRLYDF